MTVETDTATSETTPTPAAAAPTKPVVAASDLPPEALSKRLEQAKHAAQTELLKTLGITDVEEAKAALAAHVAQKEAAKTTEQKLAALELQAKTAAEALDTAVKQAVGRITPEQKAAVDAIAGDDKALWVKTYAAMSPTWTTPASVATSAPAAPAAPVVPATSAPAAPAPSPTGATSPPNHKARYAHLQTENPFAAAAYLQKHGSDCFK